MGAVLQGTKSFVSFEEAAAVLGDRGELGKVVFIEANFSNERALEITPDTWRWYRAKAPGGPLSQLAIHQFDTVHFIGGEISDEEAQKITTVGEAISYIDTHMS